jgi:CheY-like chemotaxis protein
MKDCITSLNELLSSLLDISCLDAGIVKPSFEHIDMHRLLNRVANNIKGQTENKGLKLRVYCQSVWVNSDSVLLENSIRNLLNNAIKYTNKGGILIACRSRKNTVSVEIWDTGIGITKNELDYIFEEFYQVNNAERDRSRGLGLGLSIVMREMSILGHELFLESREGQGTRVRISLEPVYPERFSIEQAVSINPYDKLANKKVLVVDDEQSILTATQMLISKWGCSVEIASNYDEASAICEHFIPDVIISDFRLKEHSTGVDLIKQLRLQLHQNIPAILITGDTAPDRLQQAKASALMLLHKPVKPAKLKVAINMVLSKK